MPSLLYDNDISKMSYSIGIHFYFSLILAGEDGVYQYGEPYMDSLMALTAYTRPKLKINFRNKHSTFYDGFNFVNTC